MIFLYNFTISCWVFWGWFWVGLGPALFLLPRSHQRQAFLIAPLLGMCLLELLGFAQISVLLVPYTPRLNLLLLLILSAFFCIRMRKILILSAKSEFINLFCLAIIPATILILFAWLFHHGLHLLVGGSDQLQYCLNAKQILEHMHTGAIIDLPIPRHDYFIQDVATRTLAYLDINRRGAELMLASIKSITGLSYSESFPMAVLCVLLSLGLALGFIGKFLRLSLSFCVILQVIFLYSFYFLLLQVQGSLALLFGLGPCLISLTLLSRSFRTYSWQWLLLTAIFIAAYFSIYAEPAIINIGLAILFLILLAFQRSKNDGFKALGLTGALCAWLVILAPFGVVATTYRLFENSTMILQSIYHSSGSNLSASSSFLHSFFSNDWLTQWLVFPNILGITSYYDSSQFNAVVAVWTTIQPWVIPVVFLFLCTLALWGFCKTKNSLARVLGLLLLVWIFVCVTTKNDSLRFVRSLHYLMPFIFIGLVMVVNLFSKRQFFYSNVVASVGAIILVAIIFFNLFTMSRTIDFLVAHDLSNDLYVLRFDERDPTWKSLHDELQLSALAHVPLLISGYKETVRPLAIVVNSVDQPEILGRSISNFWRLYQTRKNFLYRYINTRLTREQFNLAQQEEEKHWSKNFDLTLIAQSEQAIVPNGNGFPIEWQFSRDVYAPRMKRFTNIGDVFYRHQYAVMLKPEMTSPIKKDKQGNFRWLIKSGPVTILNSYQTSQNLVINFVGNAKDLKLKIGQQLYVGQQLPNGQVRLAVKVEPADVKNIRMQLTQRVKLRSMSWLPA